MGWHTSSSLRAPAHTLPPRHARTALVEPLPGGRLYVYAFLSASVPADRASMAVRYFRRLARLDHIDASGRCSSLRMSLLRRPNGLHLDSTVPKSLLLSRAISSQVHTPKLTLPRLRQPTAHALNYLALSDLRSLPMTNTITSKHALEHPARGEIIVEKRREVKWKEEGLPPPAHHANDSMTQFRNPWPSFRYEYARVRS